MSTKDTKQPANVKMSSRSPIWARPDTCRKVQLFALTHGVQNAEQVVLAGLSLLESVGPKALAKALADARGATA